MLQTPQQTRKTVASRMPVPNQDEFDIIQPQVDLLQSALHLLFAAITTRSSLQDMLAVSRVLSYTANQYSQLLNSVNHPLTAQVLQLDWDGIFDHIWTLDLEQPAPFLPHCLVNH